MFQVDALQPSHLGSVMRAGYWLLSRLAIGLVLGVTEGTYLGLIQWAQAPFTTSLSRGVSVGLLFGTGAGLIDMVWHDHLNCRLHQPHRRATWWPYGVVNVLLLFTVFAMANWALWHTWERAGFGIVWALIVGLRSRRSGLVQDIRMPDVRAWSWLFAVKGFAIGAMIGAIFLISLGRIPSRLRRRKLGPAYPQYPAACGGVIYFRFFRGACPALFDSALPASGAAIAAPSSRSNPP